MKNNDENNNNVINFGGIDIPFPRVNQFTGWRKRFAAKVFGMLTLCKTLDTDSKDNYLHGVFDSFEFILKVLAEDEVNSKPTALNAEHLKAFYVAVNALEETMQGYVLLAEKEQEEVAEDLGGKEIDNEEV